MKRSSKEWGIVLFLLSMGCARPDVPQGLTPASEALRQASGAQVFVRTGSSIVRGELLSVETDTLFLIDGNILVALCKDQVVEAKAFLQEYPLTSGDVAAWTVVGTLSTLSNGMGLIITAPLWLITAAVTGTLAASSANNGDFRYPEDSWGGLRKFARFPQGFPPGIPREQLKEAFRAPEPFR
jgi:hypothetical protein